MRIQHNIMALNSYRQLGGNNSALAKNLEKLSSGYRINRAGDDAAGLAISEKMRAQIKGLEAAQKSANDGISLVQTAEGALTEAHSMLNRMTYLATQSANGTYDNEVDRANLDKEFQTLKEEIDRIAQATNFNGINLLDGSLSTGNITTEGMKLTQIDTANGVTITQGDNGGGSKGEFSIDLTNAFGDGDTIAIQFGGTLGTAFAGADTLTLTYGTDFSGDTIEKQAESIKNKLLTDTNIAQNFNVTVDGTKVTLTANKEGNKATEVGTVVNVTATDKKAVADATWKESVPAAGDSTSEAIHKFVNLFAKNDASGMDIKNGDVLSFDIEAADGTKYTAKLTVGTDFQIGTTENDTINNLKDALENKATFEQNDSTVADETKMKFGDLFAVANDGAGGLTITEKGSITNAGKFTIKNEATGKSATGAYTPAGGGDAAAQKYTMALKAGEAQNLAIGDKLTFKGTLSDGRTFEFEVEAGKDFKVDNAGFSGATSTLKNLEDLLETKGMDIKLSDGSTVKSNEIFGTGAGKELDFDGAAGTITANRAGTVAAGSIQSVTLTSGEAASLDSNLINGAQQTAATSTIEFGEGVNYGSVIEVNGQKYEIVKDADDITAKGNKAIVVSDIKDTASIAKAMAGALKNDLSDTEYEISVSGSKVNIKTTEIGSAAKAATVSSSGDKVSQIEFTLDPKKMQEGTTVTINGQTYEFVTKGNDVKTQGATKIEVDDFEKATSESLGKLLSDTANGVKGAQVLADADGKVTVRGIADKTGKVETPTVKFADGKGGLTMQIGDTAADYNKIKVSIYDMHCADMGIGDTDIKTIDTAAAAIDKIKSAINYVSDVRGDLGAIQNRLEHTINNLGVQTENITAAESRIRDTDMAEEMMAYTKNNILVQAAQAMLAQANQVPQGILQLLQ